MCDQQQKVKNKKTDAKSQEMRRHHSKQNHRHPHHHHHKFHQSDEDNQDTHSTAEDSLLSDHLPHHHHHHSHHYRHDQLSLSETSFTSSYGSSSSTFSSSSTTASSSSRSSSSSTSSTSASSSSLSSESSSEGSDTFLLRRPQHSQSCTNISEKCKYVEEREDAAPLIGNRSHVGKQKPPKGKSAHNVSKQDTQKKTHESASFRKSKSMEALTRPLEKDGHANEEEEERRKNQVRKNLMKEKMKFSAFLNEITRQVLSPMRLTTLGVTNAQKANSSEPASVRSRKSETNTDRSQQQRSRPVSPDSVESSQYSHSQLSKSKSSHHHHRRRSHRSPDSTNHAQARPRSCTDISCPDRHPSWSQTSQHRSPSPYRKPHRKPCRHHSDRRSPSYHKYPRGKSPHRHRRRYSPIFYPSQGDSDSSSYHHDKRSPRTDYRDPTFHQQGDGHYRYHNRGNLPRYGDHHRDEQQNRAPAHHQIRNSASQHHKDHPGKSHHHSNHLNTKRPTTPRHGNQAQDNKPYSKHHHGNHHGIDQHHNFRPGIHNHGAHGDGGHHPHQKAKPNEFGEHHRASHHGSHHSPNRQRHRGDDRKEVHQPDNEESQNSYHEQRSGRHHSPNQDDLNTHEDHHHRDHHSPNGQHPSSHRQHHHGDHKSPNNHHQHEGHHIRILRNQHGDSRQHEPHQSKHLAKNKPENEDKHVHINKESAPSLPPHQKKAVLSSKMDSTRKMTSPSGRDEEQTDFTGPSIPQEPTHEMDKIMTLQEANEGLQQSLVKMECFGEFLNSHKLLEEELQRTRVELSNLTESFRILHENCSSTQQTNNLLEHKLNFMTLSMEGERERLSRRISALTEQLAGAKFVNMDSLNVTSVLNQTNEHLHPDDAISQVMLPLAPPPVQFMDSQNYEKVQIAGQEQCLGSVPEEEESDWSEMGEEIPPFILTGSNRSQAWMDKDSESGGMTGDSTFRITPGPNLGSTLLIRSASLEEIPLACHQMPKELRGTEAMMDLHRPAHEASDDLDNEIIHHWRTNKRDGRGSEAESAPCSLQSVDQMLDRFMCEPQAGEGMMCQSRFHPSSVKRLNSRRFIFWLSPCQLCD
ncbi:uncharacterized protein LOC144036222 isoform X2 [Vanacampus margaritifer]